MTNFSSKSRSFKTVLATSCAGIAIAFALSAQAAELPAIETESQVELLNVQSAIERKKAEEAKKKKQQDKEQLSTNPGLLDVNAPIASAKKGDDISRPMAPNVGNACSDGDLAGSLQCGDGADASGGSGATAIGDNTVASGSQSTAIGNNARATDSFTTSVGRSANATGLQSTALGAYAIASGSNSLAIGASAEATGLRSTSVGENSGATNADASAFG